jgi:hypothetical protein
VLGLAKTYHGKPIYQLSIPRRFITFIHVVEQTVS